MNSIYKRWPAFSFFLLLTFGTTLLLRTDAAAKETPTPQEKAYFDKVSQLRKKYYPREQRTFKLKNGLEVLIIQDPREKMAAVSLDVKVGLYQDPPQYPGLAHYLEHVLFLGTEKYPKPEEYMDFVSKNTGYTNAFTDKEHTNFQFQVAPTAFEPTLDRFAQFFIHPKFDVSYVTKELENIDSEYKKNLDNVFRSFHLLNRLASSAHPQSRVFQGNKESLGKIPRSVILDFYKQYYSADRMKLVVLSPLPIQMVEKAVQSRFSSVPVSSKKPNFRFSEPIYPKKDLPRLVELKAVGDHDVLILLFPIPPSEDYFYSKPIDYITSLLTRGGDGSFKKMMEKKGLVNEIYAGLHTDNLDQALYQIVFILPKEKRDHWKEITSLFFGYTQFLRKEGLKKQYFLDIQKRAELGFVYSSPSGGLSEATSLASDMHYHPPFAISVETGTFARHSNETFEKVLESFNPEQVQVVRVRPDLQGDLFEQKYNIDYHISKLDPKLIQSWKTQEPDAETVYPQLNPYLPKHLRLLGKHQELPQIVKDSPKEKLWIKADHSFELPKAILSYEILTKAPRTTHYVALTHLYQRAIEKSHPQWRALTSEAGLNASFGPHSRGFTLHFAGYSDRMKEYAADFISKLSTIDISEQEFDNIKNDEIRGIENEKFLDAYQFAFRRISQIFDPYSFLSEEILPDLKKITLDQVKNFAKKPFEKIYVRGYGFGSISPDIVQDVSDQIFSAFKAESLNPSQRPKYEKLHLPSGKAFRYWDQVNGKNNAWLLAYQFGKSTPELDMAVEIGHGILSTPFYHEMRTQRGFGYIAEAMSHSDALSCSFGFLIQSDRSVKEVVPAAEDWIKKAIQGIHQTSEQDFKQIKATLLETLKKKPSTFEEKSWEISSALFTHQEDLKWKEKRIEALEKISLNRVAEIFTQAMNAKSRQRISIFVLGKDANPERCELEDEEVIQNMEDFKSGSERYTLDF